MSESDPKVPKKEGNFLSGFLKFLFFVLAFFGVMITILFNMGGASETLHQSLEKLISDSLNGRPARVIKLNKITFFPSVGADFEKLEVKETMASQDLTVSAEKVRIFLSFWGFITRQMGIKSLYIENLKVKKGILGRNAFSIEKLFIDHDKGTQQAVMRANGSLEEFPWTLAMDLEVSGAIGSFAYHIGDDRDTSFELGDLRVKATINKQNSDYLMINNFSVGLPEDILKGQLSVSLLEGHLVKVGGRLTSGDPASILNLDLLIDYGGNNLNITGEVKSVQLDTAQITGSQGPVALFNRLHQMLAYDLNVPQKKESKKDAKSDGKKDDKSTNPEPGSEKEKQQKPAERESAFACRYDFNLRFSVQKTVDKSGEEGPGLEFQAENKNGNLTVSPLKGEVESYEGPCRAMDVLKVQLENKGSE